MPKSFERKEKSQPKHKPTASSGASRAPRPPPVQQPGWKGPTYLHKKPARPKPSSSSSSTPAAKPQPQPLPFELQQLVLDVFRDAFPAVLDFEALKPTLTDINAALQGRRDVLAAALGSEECREAFVVRWAPSRAVCCANLLGEVLGAGGMGAEVPWVADFLRGGGSARVVCLGGGAAEVMAFAALLRHLRPEARGKPASSRGEADQDPQDQQVPFSDMAPVPEGGKDIIKAPPGSLKLTLVDNTDWVSVVAKLERGLSTPPALSKYASAAARANNASFIVAEAMRAHIIRADVLSSGIEDLRDMIGADPTLITLFFALNNLYTTSIAKTTKLLVGVTLVAPKDSLLLVVDSPGCYVETAGAGKGEGEEGKRYSMAWLMDHLLLDEGKRKGEAVQSEDEEQEDSGPAWEKILSDESRLLRLDDRLEYPGSLENTRFQVHLFRRL